MRAQPPAPAHRTAPAGGATPAGRATRVDLRRLPWVDVPLALARLHDDRAVDQTVVVRLPAPDGQAPGAADIFEGAGFAPTSDGSSETAMALRRLHTLPDVVGPGMRALICGLNPSLISSDAGFAYAGANNRFWPAAESSGLVRVTRAPFESLRLDRVGITDVAKRATARSHHLDPAEYQAGLGRLQRLAAWLGPGVVIFVGLEGWRTAWDRKAVAGWQEAGIGGRPAYVMPSTSGANARTSLAELTDHLTRALAGPGVSAG